MDKYKYKYNLCHVCKINNNYCDKKYCIHCLFGIYYNKYYNGRTTYYELNKLNNYYVKFKNNHRIENCSIIKMFGHCILCDALHDKYPKCIKYLEGKVKLNNSIYYKRDFNTKYSNTK